MNLKVINEDFSVCQLNDLSHIPFNDEFFFLAKTDEELSLVCTTKSVPENHLTVEHGWVALRIEGILDFSLVGILAKISSILASEQISIFALSTYNTDYILIKKTQLDKTILTLKNFNYTIIVEK